MKKLITTISVLILTMILMIGCQSESLLNDTPESLTIIEDFKSLEDSFIDYKFKVSEKADSFVIEGKYDLNNDGKKDKISLVLQNHSDTRVERLETYIEVNGIKQEIKEGIL